MPEPEEGGLEKKLNNTKTAPAKTGNIFDQIGGSIDSIVAGVKAIPKVAKKAAHYTYYTAKAAAGLAAGVAIAGASALIGAPISVATATNVLHAGYRALIFPFGMAAGTWLSNKKNKKETTFKQIANEIAIGGLLGATLNYMFKGVTYAGNAVKPAYGALASLITRAGVGLATIPPFLTTHEYLNRALIKDYKAQPLNIGKKLKKMWPIIPPVIANFSVVPEYLGAAYQMPVAAGIATAYGLLKGDKKKEENKEKAPETHKLPQPAESYAKPKAA